MNVLTSYWPLVPCAGLAATLRSKVLAPTRLLTRRLFGQPAVDPRQCELQARVDALAKEMGVTKALEVYFEKGDNFASAEGTHCLGGRAGIIFGDAIFAESEKTQNFIIRHELGHILHNDFLVAGLVSAAASFGAGAVTAALTDGYASVVAATVAYIGAFLLCNRVQERRADDVAIRYSSDEERRAGQRLFVDLQQQSLARKAQRRCSGACLERLQHHLVSDSGENHLDLTHPSRQARIAAIAAALNDPSTHPPAAGDGSPNS